MDRAGLYVHIPFCRSKCDYCDFYSVVPAEGQAAAFVAALLSELRGGPAGASPSLAVRTIFVGGGTPTTLPAAELGRVTEALRRIARRDGVEEFSVEANPATLDDAKASVLCDAGVTRLSMGVQSWHPEELAVLGRSHVPEDVPRTFATAWANGFEHLGCDLIFGIPGQTTATWGETLRRTIDLEPEHVSCYGLTYEAETPLHRRVETGRVATCPEDQEATLYEQAIDTLGAAGFEHYEISNFARPGAQCRHNLGYWRNEPYVGIGPSAASYVGGVRSRNVADVSEYVRRVRDGASATCESEQLEPRAAMGETAMLGLRLIEGIDRTCFRKRYGADPADVFREAIGAHVSGGRVEITATHVRLTRRGLLVADVVMEDFVPDAAGEGAQAAFFSSRGA